MSFSNAFERIDSINEKVKKLFMDKKINVKQRMWEWADKNCTYNFIKSKNCCPNDCKYCYVKAMNNCELKLLKIKNRKMSIRKYSF